MKVVGVLAITCLLVCTVASEKTFCTKRCDTFEENDKKACLFGCSNRGSVSSGGPLSFIKCHRACDSTYNETISEKGACHTACSLPMHSSVMMTLVNDNGSPKWKVVRQEGDEDPVTTIEESPLGSLLGQSRDGGLLALRAPDTANEIDEDSSSEDVFGDFSRMHERMQNVFDKFRRHMEQMRARMEGNVARQRPSGHSPWHENSITVGNENEEGQPIIITRPIASEDGDSKGILLELHHRESRSRLMVLFHWLLVLTGIVALFTTFFAVCLFLRSLRAKAYHRMAHDSTATIPIFARVQPISPLPVKKTPTKGWEQEPIGVPPPPYDQVYIHSPIGADSDKSTSEAETPSPVR